MKDSLLIGSQQLIKLYLELFLINLIRNNTYIEKQKGISLITRQRVEDHLLNLYLGINLIPVQCSFLGI